MSSVIRVFAIRISRSAAPGVSGGIFDVLIGAIYCAWVARDTPVVHAA